MDSLTTGRSLWIILGPRASTRRASCAPTTRPCAESAAKVLVELAALGLISWISFQIHSHLPSTARLKLRIDGGIAKLRGSVHPPPPDCTGTRGTLFDRHNRHVYCFARILLSAPSRLRFASLSGCFDAFTQQKSLWGTYRGTKANLQDGLRLIVLRVASL